jgi:predicted RNA-binding protein YlqC (UPF0109 family)
MKTLVQSIVRALVDYSDEVSVTELHGHSTTIIELSVAKEDLGKVIGKRGRTINAIRTVLNAAGASEQKRVVLDVAG